MKEILAGDGFIDALRANGVPAIRTYDGESYEVWELDDAGFNTITSIPDNEWKPEWGWFRYSVGCNITHWPTHTFVVNGYEMNGWYRENEPKWLKEIRFSQRYSSLTEYLCDVIGASTEGNVCAVATDLAKLNGLSLAELFARYHPIGRDKKRGLICAENKR